MTTTQQEKLTAIFARFLAEVQGVYDARDARGSEFVNSKQAGALLGGLCRQSVANYEKSGRLKSYRVTGGRKKMFKRQDVISLLESTENGGVK